MTLLRNLRWILPLGCAGLAACMVGVDGGGYDGGPEVGYVGTYYEPSGYYYGGWDRGYHVGPGRGGERRSGATHAYRAAPTSRSTPSIPNHSRRH